MNYIVIAIIIWGWIAYYLNIAAGSASEVEEELLLSFDLEFMDKASYLQLNDEVNDIKAMLNRLIETLH